MVADFIEINKWLLPFSWLYGAGVWLRNKLFDFGLLPQKAYPLPVIAIGNITVGGTGKTPHVEYLIRLLQDKKQVAVVSRGYKRKTRGYVVAGDDTAPSDIGDEPYQMKGKFPKVYVAVDANRCEAIDTLTHDSHTCDTDVVLLDDAFQHRYVKPGMNILLVDYHRLIIYDKLLPAGRLREQKRGKDRADIVIVTKCPCDLNPMQKRELTKVMDLYPYQQLYFTQIVYDKAVLAKIQGHNVLLVTGIGSPRQMENDIKKHCLSVVPMAFADHHDFTLKDTETINQAFAAMRHPKLIVTTEKDFVRIKGLHGLDGEVTRSITVLPIVVRFMFDQENTFNENILSYVRKNSRDSVLDQGKDAGAPNDSNCAGHRPRAISF